VPDSIHSTITSGIYAIVNMTNGMAYIGQSIDIWRRWGAHRCNLIAGGHHCRPLQSAWSMAGGDAFLCIVLAEEPDPDLRTKAEQCWMDRVSRFLAPASDCGAPITTDAKRRSGPS